jgi:hypothetical protein
MRKLLAWVAAVLAALSCGCRDKAPQGTNPTPASDRDASPGPRVSIRGRTWSVEPATTAKQQYHGLAGRQHLADDAGMLFIYPSPRVLNYCMRGCFITLDIAFIAADGRVVKIHTMQVEPDMVGRVAYSSEAPAQYALETAGGALGRAGVREGDVVTFLGNIPAPAKVDDEP